MLPGVHDSLLTSAGGVRVKLRWEMADLCGMLRIIWPEAVSQMWTPPGNKLCHWLTRDNTGFLLDDA